MNYKKINQKKIISFTMIVLTKNQIIYQVN